MISPCHVGENVGTSLSITLPFFNSIRVDTSGFTEIKYLQHQGRIAPLRLATRTTQNIIPRIMIDALKKPKPGLSSRLIKVPTGLPMENRNRFSLISSLAIIEPFARNFCG